MTKKNKKSSHSRNKREENFVNEGKEASPTLIRTKLHRPPIPHDWVKRTQLLELLSQSLQRLITLVSAPAGYGKSVLVSSWLETSDCPGGWVSLDDEDNDPRQFLSYLLFNKIRTQR